MYGKLQEAVLNQIIPLICTLTLQRDYPLLSHPEVAAVADGWAAGSLFNSILSSHRAYLWGWLPSLMATISFVY